MKNLITNVIVRLDVEALHCWPAAREVFPEVSFLSDPHRHIFHIQLKKRVYHDDRDIEFIIFKRDVLDYLKRQYYSDIQRIHDFGNKSCEMIAKELFDQFHCEYVSVFEDNENGAEVYLDD